MDPNRYPEPSDMWPWNLYELTYPPTDEEIGAHLLEDWAEWADPQ